MTGHGIGASASWHIRLCRSAFGFVLALAPLLSAEQSLAADVSGGVVF